METMKKEGYVKARIGVVKEVKEEKEETKQEIEEEKQEG